MAANGLTSSHYSSESLAAIASPHSKEAERLRKDVRLIGTNSNKEVSAGVAAALGMELVPIVASKFANSERHVIIEKSVRGKDVFIIGTGGQDGSMHILNQELDEMCKLVTSLAKDPDNSALAKKIEDKKALIKNLMLLHNSANDYLMEMLIILDACKRSDAKTVTLVILNYPYARQDKRDRPRAPISSRLLADMIEKAGVTRVVSMDFHASQLQGFFNYPVDNLYAINLIGEALRDRISENKDQYVIISPDGGGSKRVSQYAKMLGLKTIVMYKERDHSKENTVTTSRLMGDPDAIKGKTGIIIDDMADTMGTVTAAVREQCGFGMKDCIVAVTHGILSGPALDRIMGCEAIREVIVTNTLPQETNLKLCEKEGVNKLTVIDVSPLIADVIHNIVFDGSISGLFELFEA